MGKSLERIAVALEAIAKELSQKNERSKRIQSAKTPRIKEADLDDVYALYPRKLGKASAYKKLLATMTPEELPLLKQAVESAASSWSGTEEKFIPHFSTFASKWKDYLPQEQTLFSQPKAEIDLSSLFVRK